MANRAFPLSVQTEFVENLSRLSGIPGAVDTVLLAGTIQSEVQARFIRDAISMMARYNSGARLASITAKGVIGRDRNRTIVVPAPVDYVSWTRRVSTLCQSA